MKKNRSIFFELAITLGGLNAVVMMTMAFAFGILTWNQKQFDVLYVFIVGVILIGGIFCYSLKKLTGKIVEIQKITYQLSLDGSALPEKNAVLKNSSWSDVVLNNCFDVVEEMRRYQDFFQTLIEDSEIITQNDRMKIEKSMDLDKVIENDRHIRLELEQILEQYRQGEYGEVLIVSNLTGRQKKWVETVNQILENVVDKILWYESFLDAITYPIHATDLNGNELYMNKALEEILSNFGEFPGRNQVYGTKTCDEKIAVCLSEECPESCTVRRLLAEGISETDVFYEGNYVKMSSAYIYNRAGERIGIAEISANTTPIMSVNAYTQKEIIRLNENLNRLALGNLEFDRCSTEGNEFTDEAKKQFASIMDNLDNVRQSISDLVKDGTMLTDSVLNGDFNTKAEEERFSGSWRTMIEGMNRMLAVIAKPVQEVTGVMESIANGKLDCLVMGDYEGEFARLKKSVNHTTANLNQVMAEITTVTGALGQGILDIPGISEFKGDFSKISRSLNEIVNTLNTLLTDVNIAANQVSLGAHQVSNGSQTLAQGATEQASSIQELTASAAEISDQTKNNAINANEARERTILVREHAGEGNHKMSQMQQSMQKINQSSKDISKIIKVIDEIAFQTNILALNAAVEAARAGQHGKGFAVVAEEVRTLAARSAEAAKETTVLIEGSIRNVEAGTVIADETATSLTEIVDEINRVTNLMEQIAEASSEQATGIAQFSKGLEMVGQVVQQNSATAEESAAASEELSGQAMVLQEMVGQFRLRNEVIDLG